PVVSAFGIGDSRMRTVTYSQTPGLLLQPICSQSIPFRNTLARRLGINRIIGCVFRVAEEEIYANTLARPALRRADATEESGLHFDRRRHAGARHWRKHGDFLRHQCHSHKVAAV